MRLLPTNNVIGLKLRTTIKPREVELDRRTDACLEGKCLK